MALDDGVLQLLAAVVDQNAQSAANHEDIVRGEDIHNQDDDDGQGQDHIEEEVLRASQLIVLLFAIRIIVLAGILYGSIAQLGNALLLLEAPEDGSADGKDQADDLHRNDLTPQVIGLNAQNTGGTHGRAAPGQQVHDTHRRNADQQQGLTAHVQALVDRQHGGDGDEERGCTAAVQMADNGDQAGHQGNADHIVADLFHQRADDLVEHSGVGHNAEEQDREDEQDRGTMDAFHALLDKVCHLIEGERTGCHQNGSRDGRDTDESQCRDRDIAQQQNDDRNHRCKAEQSEDRITHVG